jgi:uncharacterized membrane protein YfcA
MIEVCIGLLGGILIGATGAGVGLLVTPLLVLAGYRPAVAIAVGLGALVASKFFGALLHHQLGHWPGSATWILVVGGTGGAALTWWALHPWMAANGASTDAWLKRLLGLALLAAAFGLLLISRNGHSQPVFDAEKRPTVLFLLGAGVGAPVALTSMGSGSLLVPMLTLVTHWNVPQLAATSNLFGCVVGVLTVALQARLGPFDWELFAKVLGGLLPGVGMGVLLSRVIPRRWFARAVSIIAIYLGGRLLLG